MPTNECAQAQQDDLNVGTAAAGVTRHIAQVAADTNLTPAQRQQLEQQLEGTLANLNTADPTWTRFSPTWVPAARTPTPLRHREPRYEGGTQ